MPGNETNSHFELSQLDDRMREAQNHAYGVVSSEQAAKAALQRKLILAALVVLVGALLSVLL